MAKVGRPVGGGQTRRVDILQRYVPKRPIQRFQERFKERYTGLKKMNMGPPSMVFNTRMQQPRYKQSVKHAVLNAMVGSSKNKRANLERQELQYVNMGSKLIKDGLEALRQTDRSKKLTAKSIRGLRRAKRDLRAKPIAAPRIAKILNYDAIKRSQLNRNVIGPKGPRPAQFNPGYIKKADRQQQQQQQQQQEQDIQQDVEVPPAPPAPAPPAAAPEQVKKPSSTSASQTGSTGAIDIEKVKKQQENFLAMMNKAGIPPPRPFVNTRGGNVVNPDPPDMIRAKKKKKAEKLAAARAAAAKEQSRGGQALLEMQLQKQKMKTMKPIRKRDIEGSRRGIKEEFYPGHGIH